MFKIAGPKTLRLASAQILTKQLHVAERRPDGTTGYLLKRKGWGGNLQNIEKGQREIYIPDGVSNKLLDKLQHFSILRDLSIFTEEELEILRIFVQVDQSGAEALIVAYCCEAGAYRSLFTNGIKPHTFLGMHLFKDVWRTKMLESKAVTKDSGFDIDEMCRTSIPLLKMNPFWRDLDLLIKDSDNWPVDQRYYYLAKQTEHSCVDGQTEVLTRKGWRKIESVADIGTLTTEIAIYNKGLIQFEIPKVWNKMYITDTMYSLVGEETDQFVTGNHRVLYSSNGKQHIKYAKDIMHLNRPNIPTSGCYIGGSLDVKDWVIQLLVAIQADGHWCKSEAEGTHEYLPKVIFRLKRDRKITRLLDILRQSGLTFSKELHANDVTCITVTGLEEVLRFFQGQKIWGSWLLDFSANNLALFVDELKYWDGTFDESYRHKREAYFTKYSTNAAWVKTICHLIGKQGTRNVSQDGLHIVGINSRQQSVASNKQRILNWTGFVYCPTVSSGLFMIRRNGKISVTGNSNYDIHPPTFRMNILEKSGGKIVISKEDSERFLATKHSLFPEIKGYHRYVQSLAEKHRRLYNLHGHPYEITHYELQESNWKELYAWIPQSTVGEITNIAYTRMQQYITDSKVKWDLLSNTHDSYLLQCPLMDMRDCALKAKEFMEQEFVSPIDGAKFRMRSEAQAGFNWSPAKKDKNVIGLREIKGI